MKWITTLLFLPLLSYSQNITISGYIKDSGSKEALIGATIYETVLKKGAAANEYGFYSFTIPAGDTLNVIISYVGYKPQAKKIVLKENTRLDILLDPSNTLNEVEISATRNDDNVNKAQVGVIDVPMREIKNLPMLGGERDIFKIIQLLPGVQQA